MAENDQQVMHSDRRAETSERQLLKGIVVLVLMLLLVGLLGWLQKLVTKGENSAPPAGAVRAADADTGAS